MVVVVSIWVEEGVMTCGQTGTVIGGEEKEPNGISKEVEEKVSLAQFYCYNQLTHAHIYKNKQTKRGIYIPLWNLRPRVVV